MNEPEKRNKFGMASYASPQEAVMASVMGNTIHWPRKEMSKGKGVGKGLGRSKGKGRGRSRKTKGFNL